MTQEQTEYFASEPYLVPDPYAVAANGDLPNGSWVNAEFLLERLSQRRGFRVTGGGRFFHQVLPDDLAVVWLVSWEEYSRLDELVLAHGQLATRATRKGVV